VLITATSALVLSRRHTAALGGSYLLAAVILAFFEPNLQASRQQPAVELTTVVAMDMFVASLIILIPTIVILVGQMVREQAQANSLLLNVLPEVIADRLKESPGVIADSFEDCTVLFADLVGFTEYAATVAPERLVALLNLIFSRFDELVAQRGAEKIKTVGDGYLVIAGAPVPRPDHVATMCHLALEMQETIGKLNAEQGSDFRLRIGLNTGPVVAGVIGESRFSYDLWGDTVNLASRMQSRGHPGAVQTTEVVYLRARESFRFEPAGIVDLRGRKVAAISSSDRSAEVTDPRTMDAEVDRSSRVAWPFRLIRVIPDSQDRSGSPRVEVFSFRGESVVRAVFRAVAVLALTASGCNQDLTVAPTSTTSTAPGPTLGPTTTQSSQTALVASSTTSTDGAVDDPDNALKVSTAPIELPAEILAVTEGMVLGVGEEFVWDDGAQGLRDIIVRVENGQAMAVRGRWCGTLFGPAPLDDLMGGAVVLPETRPPTRCTPGHEVTEVSAPNAIPADTAVVDGVTVLAYLRVSESARESAVDIVDLETLETRTLYATDIEVEVPIAASRSENGVWVLTLRSQPDDSSTVRYVFVDDSGESLTLQANPQPEFPQPDTGFRIAALAPDGSSLVIVDEESDGSVDIVIWDLDLGAQVSRIPILDSSVDQWIGTLDVNEKAVVVNTLGADEEIHPVGMLLMDLASGAWTEIGGRYDGLEIRHGTFLGR